MQRALDVAGIICRYTLAVLAGVWFIEFLFVIGQSAERSQELAGMAIGRAVICAGAAAIWFYRARKAKQMQRLVEYSLKARQSQSPFKPTVPPPLVPTNQRQVATSAKNGPEPPEANKMTCCACGKESAEDFTFCPQCGEQQIVRAACRECGKESASEFKFCPHCGTAFAPLPSAIEAPSPSQELQPVADALTDESEPIRDGVAGTAIRVGTLVFGAFSAISLLVSIVKGLVPIFLLEAAGWAGIAWYWQVKKTHSDGAKAIVIVLAVLVAIGEVVHIASQPDSKSTAPTASDPFAAYGGHEVAPAEASAASHIADVERQAVALFSQKQYKEARPLFEQACNGTDENGFKYAGFDGEMKACNYLGYFYAQGLGGAHDMKKARDAYQKACDQGILPSCASLGTLYQDAGDTGNARKYFQKACDGGVPEGCDLLRGVK